jgi:hypothetical protein
MQALLADFTPGALPSTNSGTVYRRRLFFLDRARPPEMEPISSTPTNGRTIRFSEQVPEDLAEQGLIERSRQNPVRSRVEDLVNATCDLDYIRPHETDSYRTTSPEWRHLVMKTETRTKVSKSSAPNNRPADLLELNKTASERDQLHALLYEALETEQGGVLVYETALRCAINDDLLKEWEEYLSQTKNHVTILTNVLKKLGLNPDQDTPGRTVVRYSGMSLVKTMEVALLAGKPQAAEIVAAECVVQAETKDHMNWQLIGAVSKSLTGTEQEVLQKAYEQVEDEEDEHLYHTTGWARELHFQALGLPAQLPPAEEQHDVKTEMEAAAVRKERNETLASNQKGDLGEEASRQESSRVQRSEPNKQKRQTRRSAA